MYLNKKYLYTNYLNTIEVSKCLMLSMIIKIITLNRKILKKYSFIQKKSNVNHFCCHSNCFEFASVNWLRYPKSYSFHVSGCLCINDKLYTLFNSSAFMFYCVNIDVF